MGFVGEDRWIIRGEGVSVFCIQGNTDLFTPKGLEEYEVDLRSEDLIEQSYKKGFSRILG